VAGWIAAAALAFWPGRRASLGGSLATSPMSCRSSGGAPSGGGNLDAERSCRGDR
jgi:hypothetical protein